LDAETCRGFNEHNKLLTTPLSITWFLSPIYENARYNDKKNYKLFCSEHITFEKFLTLVNYNMRLVFVSFRR
jgi:hypothetical protein